MKFPSVALSHSWSHRSVACPEQEERLCPSPLSLSPLIHLRAFTIINMLTVPKGIYPFQISLPDSRFMSSFLLDSWPTYTYKCVRPRVHLGMLNLPPKTCSTCSLSPFQLMATDFFQVLSTKNLGVFFIWLSLLPPSNLSGNPVGSPLKICSNFVHFSLFPLTVLGLSHLRSLLDYCLGLLTGLPDRLVLHTLSQHDSWVEL